MTSLVGLILGIVAAVKIGGSKGRLRGRGLAIGGIAASCVLLLAFLLVLMIAIMTSALSRVRELALTESCSKKLRNIGFAALAYANDNRDQMPDRISLVLGPYLRNDYDVLLSPLDQERTFADIRQDVDSNSSYILVPGLRGGDPSSYIVGYSKAAGVDELTNVLLMDMTVVRMTFEELEAKLDQQIAAIHQLNR
jgi:hypothetical protein